MNCKEVYNMREEWRDIKGFEGLYQISNMGNVKSLERTVWNSRGYYVTVPERIRKARKNRYGYLYVALWKEGKRKQYMIHRLVASAFLNNADNLPEINHKDEDKTNNTVDNLEWCDRSYNCNYGTRNKKISEKMTNSSKLGKSVIGINKVSGLIVEFPYVREASRQTGINSGNICACCNGKKKSAGGYIWFYAD